jgi:hypothetical protein
MLMHKLIRTSSLALCALASSVFLAACSVAPYEAKAERRLTESAAGLTAVACDSHNGSIEVIGKPDATEIGILVRMSVHGRSQEEADARLAMLDVDRKRDGKVLRLTGSTPREIQGDAASAFSFVLEVPAQFAAELLSHNGRVKVSGANGEITAVTHNGGIDCETAAPALRLETHNGSIRLTLAGSGPVRGSATSHNGSIDLVAGTRSADITAETKNGSIQAASVYSESVAKKGRLACRAGAGGAPLQLETHNGSITLR